MYVIMLFDDDKPDLDTSRCKGPFDTEAEAVKQFKQYFETDVASNSAFVIEVEKP